MKTRRILFLLFILLGLCACSKTSKGYQESEEEKVLEEKSEINNENLKDKIFEGNYFDERVYKYINMPESESPLVYCEILISNITDKSFDFIIYEKVMATGERKVLMFTSTAEFEANGSNAVYHGENRTLYFTFPDNKDLFPKHLEISGLEQTEGSIYINNTIPGHESG